MLILVGGRQLETFFSLFALFTVILELPLKSHENRVKIANSGDQTYMLNFVMMAFLYIFVSIFSKTFLINIQK